MGHGFKSITKSSSGINKQSPDIAGGVHVGKALWICLVAELWIY
jgi:hypothetical protein